MKPDTPASFPALAFGAAAPHYSCHNTCQQLLWQQLVSLLPHRHYPSLLDIGCADGALTNSLHTAVGSTHSVGIDNCPAMIAQAQKKHPLIHSRVQSACAPFPDTHYALIISNATLQWLPHFEVVLERIKAAQPHAVALSFFLPSTFSELAKTLRATLNPRSRLPAESFPSFTDIHTSLTRLFPSFTLHRTRHELTFPSVHALLRHIKQSGAQLQRPQLTLNRTGLTRASHYMQHHYGTCLAGYDAAIATIEP